MWDYTFSSFRVPGTGMKGFEKNKAARHAAQPPWVSAKQG
jgi:hypothetical protein